MITEMNIRAGGKIALILCLSLTIVISRKISAIVLSA
ncbi:Uncharacterised protein [Enterobacter asburiae]|uniref:Uncharacterized protein n=1 Tax=Enterobacter asburiae TaxID=61645 RepID=A0A376FFJ8_ENTAS|nr:Uncharacterised protein [Enterobacter asburiae]